MEKKLVKESVAKNHTKNLEHDVNTLSEAIVSGLSVDNVFVLSDSSVGNNESKSSNKNVNSNLDINNIISLDETLGVIPQSNDIVSLSDCFEESEASRKLLNHNSQQKENKENHNFFGFSEDSEESIDLSSYRRPKRYFKHKEIKSTVHDLPQNSANAIPQCNGIVSISDSSEESEASRKLLNNNSKQKENKEKNYFFGFSEESEESIHLSSYRRPNRHFKHKENKITFSHPADIISISSNDSTNNIPLQDNVTKLPRELEPHNDRTEDNSSFCALLHCNDDSSEASFDFLNIISKDECKSLCNEENKITCSQPADIISISSNDSTNNIPLQENVTKLPRELEPHNDRTEDNSSFCVPSYCNDDSSEASFDFLNIISKDECKSLFNEENKITCSQLADIISISSNDSTNNIPPQENVTKLPRELERHDTLLDGTADNTSFCAPLYCNDDSSEASFDFLSHQNVNIISRDKCKSLFNEISHVQSENNYDENKNSNQPSERAEKLGKSKCPICFKNWSMSGPHQICSLKCGHLFGASCIEHLFKVKKCCPICKRNYKSCNIRYIAEDFPTIENNHIEDLKQEKLKLLEEISILGRENEIKEFKISELNYKINRFKRNDCYIKSLDIDESGGCRAMDFRHQGNLLMVATNPVNNLFVNKYGIRKIHIDNYKFCGFTYLHQKEIRDIKFHQENPWILSVAFDKMIKVTDVNSNTKVAEFATDGPLWSACWDADNPNVFYVGQHVGTALKFDIRNMNSPITRMFVSGDMSPVVSLGSLKSNPHFPNGGLAMCKSNSMWIFKSNGAKYSQKCLPLEGPFLSCRNSWEHLLVSTNSNDEINTVRHLVYLLNSDTSLKLIDSFEGGRRRTILGRTCLFSFLNDKYAAAYNEDEQRVFLWSVTSGRTCLKVPVLENVRDLCFFQSESYGILACMSLKNIKFIKFSP